MRLAHIVLGLSRLACLRSDLSPRPVVAVQTLGIHRAGAHSIGELTRRTNFVWSAHSGLVLSDRTRCWSNHAKRSRITVDALCVDECVARGLCPLAGLAYAVNNAHSNLVLGLTVGRSLASETSRAARSALRVGGRIARCLCPLPHVAYLVSCARNSTALV